MDVGKKIRKVRIQKGLSQKELAYRARLSEPAIRNYELGNRTPSSKQLETIAGILGVSVLAISEPDIESEYGIMHVLFELERDHGATLVCEPGATYFTFNANASLCERLDQWGEVYKKYKEGTITEEEYNEWKDTYPESVIYNKR